MPRFVMKWTTDYKISPNYVPKGMVEGQVHTVESEMGLRARNLKHAHKIAFEGFKPENEWEFNRQLISIVPNDRPIVS